MKCPDIYLATFDGDGHAPPTRCGTPFRAGELSQHRLSDLSNAGLPSPDLCLWSALCSVGRFSFSAGSRYGLAVARLIARNCWGPGLSLDFRKRLLPVFEMLTLGPTLLFPNSVCAMIYIAFGTLIFVAIAHRFSSAVPCSKKRTVEGFLRC